MKMFILNSRFRIYIFKYFKDVNNFIFFNFYLFLNINLLVGFM